MEWGHGRCCSAIGVHDGTLEGHAPDEYTQERNKLKVEGLDGGQRRAANPAPYSPHGLSVGRGISSYCWNNFLTTTYITRTRSPLQPKCCRTRTHRAAHQLALPPPHHRPYQPGSSTSAPPTISIEHARFAAPALWQPTPLLSARSRRASPAPLSVPAPARPAAQPAPLW